MGKDIGTQPARPIITDEFMKTLASLDIQLRTSMTGRFGGKRRTRAYGSSLEWADYRKYISGDDPRRIDWNVAARSDQYYVKQFVDERQLNNHIYLDCSGSMAAYEEKAIMALQLAAAMAYLSISNMDRVSFRLLRNTRCEDLSGSIGGKDAFIMAAGALSKVRFEGSVDLESAVSHAYSPGRCDGVSFLISDLLTESNWKNAVDYLLEKKREVVLLHVLSPEEVRPGIRGLYRLFEIEKDVPGFKTRADYGAVRAYQKAYQEWCREIDDFCRRRNIACIRVLSNEPLSAIRLRESKWMQVIQ